MTTAAYLHRLALPAAYGLLPDRMQSPEATALLVAIALQESGCVTRAQYGGGPARGFWQFEVIAVEDVLTRRSTRGIAGDVCQALAYPASAAALLTALEHNDVLAAVWARLLLWTLPVALPRRDEGDLAWGQYLAAWHPGTPRPADWPGHHAAAWALVDGA